MGQVLEMDSELNFSSSHLADDLAEPPSAKGLECVFLVVVKGQGRYDDLHPVSLAGPAISIQPRLMDRKRRNHCPSTPQGHFTKKAQRLRLKML